MSETLPEVFVGVNRIGMFRSISPAVSAVIPVVNVPRRRLWHRIVRRSEFLNKFFDGLHWAPAVQARFIE